MGLMDIFVQKDKTATPTAPVAVQVATPVQGLPKYVPPVPPTLMPSASQVPAVVDPKFQEYFDGLVGSSVILVQFDTLIKAMETTIPDERVRYQSAMVSLETTKIATKDQIALQLSNVISLIKSKQDAMTAKIQGDITTSQNQAKSDVEKLDMEIQALNLNIEDLKKQIEERNIQKNAINESTKTGFENLSRKLMDLNYAATIYIKNLEDRLSKFKVYLGVQ